MIADKELEESPTVLKFLRETAGLTQRQLATIIDCTELTIRRCEKGEREIVLTCRQWQRLAFWIRRSFGIDLVLIEDLELSGLAEAQSIVRQVLHASGKKNERGG